MDSQQNLGAKLHDLTKTASALRQCTTRTRDKVLGDMKQQESLPSTPRPIPTCLHQQVDELLAIVRDALNNADVIEKAIGCSNVTEAVAPVGYSR